jgi:hypothetical protein
MRNVLALFLCGVSLAQAPLVSTTITFRCLWWSDQQKNGLNPNHPPPKTTEVTIKRWEYSDPIEVPHPDVLDVVVEVKNISSESLKDVVVEVATNWRVGSMKAEQSAIW